MTDPYYESRYVPDKNRPLVWKEIVSYLKKYIPENGTVLDIGAGYCDFINNVETKTKIALDYSSDFEKFANKDVKTIRSSVLDMKEISNDSIDLLFASNLLEHLSDDELQKAMSEIKRILKNNRLLILMQPNYRLSFKTYFDDPTHKKVFSDLALESFLISHGFKIELKKARFLPFSLRSKPSIIPLSSFIVRAYLYSPWKPFAGQMLFVSKLIK